MKPFKIANKRFLKKKIPLRVIELVHNSNKKSLTKSSQKSHQIAQENNQKFHHLQDEHRNQNENHSHLQ